MLLELNQGVFRQELADNEATIFINRTFTNLNVKSEPRAVVSDFVDLGQDREVDREASAKIKGLKQSLLDKVTNSLKFSVPWSGNGIDPESCSEHQEYIDELCKQYYDMASDLINKAVEERTKEDIMDGMPRKYFCAIDLRVSASTREL